MQEVNQIAEECDWKTHFTAEECVNMVSDILEKNAHLLTYSEPQSSDIQFNPKKYKLAYMRDLDMQEEEADDGCEYYTLGILDENGEFQDFYYDSSMEFDEFSDLIPKGFGEVMESCYQLKHRSNKGKTAKEVLENHGYVEVKHHE